MSIRHFFLQDKTNQVIHIRNDNQSISRQSGSIHPISCQRHIKSQRQPDQRCTHNRNDRGKTGQKAEKERTRHIEYPISEQSDQPLDDGQQRNSDCVGGDDHIDLVQDVFLILVTKRQNAVDILFHLGTTNQHEIKYQHQYGHIDGETADSSHQHLPYLRENGDSYEGNEKKTDNTNFALLVAKHFSEPFKDSNGYGESIARLSNMLGGGVIVQRFGDLVRGRRSTEKRIEEGLVTPTLSATPGDLSLVLPKRILDGIVEMIYALDKVAPGTANDDTLLYGVEVKFYNMEVDIDENLESCHKGLYVIGDGSGVTHSLSHASASGVYVARHIIEEA